MKLFSPASLRLHETPVNSWNPFFPLPCMNCGICGIFAPGVRGWVQEQQQTFQFCDCPCVVEIHSIVGLTNKFWSQGKRLNTQIILRVISVSLWTDSQWHLLLIECLTNNNKNLKDVRSVRCSEDEGDSLLRTVLLPWESVGAALKHSFGREKKKGISSHSNITDCIPVGNWHL